MACVDYSFTKTENDYIVKVEATFDPLNDGYLRFCVVISGANYTLNDYCSSMSYDVGHDDDETLNEFKFLVENSKGTMEERVKNAVKLFFEDL